MKEPKERGEVGKGGGGGRKIKPEKKWRQDRKQNQTAKKTVTSVFTEDTILITQA